MKKVVKIHSNVISPVLFDRHHKQETEQDRGAAVAEQ
jgi:hypothetical protein